MSAGYQIGQYLDISLFKVIGDNQNKITRTIDKIRITLSIPEHLKKTDGEKTREYAIIRVHNGQAAVLVDMDTDPDTITIDTDRFSIYAIVYKDAADNSANNGSNNDSNNNASGSNGTDIGQTKDNEPDTGDNTVTQIYATSAMIAGLTYLLLYFADRRRGMTEKTKKELVSSLVRWGTQGGKLRKLAALAAVFALLVYYHSIGKKTAAEWKEVCGE